MLAGPFQKCGGPFCFVASCSLGALDEESIESPLVPIRQRRGGSNGPGRVHARHGSAVAAAHLILGIALDSYSSAREALAELRQAEQLFRTPRDQARVRALIASMRQSSPDSLRELFAADSAAHVDHTP